MTTSETDSGTVTGFPSDRGAARPNSVPSSPVPDSPPDDLAPRPLWEPAQYEPLIGSGADKLTTSAVAPLVAHARGYRSVTPSGVPSALRQYGLGDRRQKEGKLLARAADTGDVLIIPLYDAHDVAQHALHDRHLPMATFQMRPREAVTVHGGAVAKYLFREGAQIPLDVHPATPVSWIAEPAVVVVSEGSIKTDAALTAVLRSTGISDHELTKTTDDPKSRLRNLMEAVDASQRVLCISVAGVANWHRHRGWNSVPTRDLPVWIAFDGDVATNRHVWREANALWEMLHRQGARPALIDLDLTNETAHGPVAAKVGLDDFLATSGRWESLYGRLVDQLPPQPANEAHAGDWRVDNERCVTVEMVAVPSPVPGQPPTMRWDERVPLGGRVHRIITRRDVTDNEERTGDLDPTAAGIDEVEIEVSWKDTSRRAGRPAGATVRGPATLLSDPPSEWHRRGGTVPAELLSHPSWPPRGVQGEKWLGALKANRQEDRAWLTTWGHMGWVPTPKSPVYIVGRQVIGPDGFCDDAIPGVDDTTLANSSRLGVDMADGLDAARRDLERVITSLDATWTDPRIGALVAGAAIRPVVPLRQHSPLLFTGAGGSGKSWTAGAIMMFWQPEPGIWNESRLPGSAKDTYAATEAAAGAAPIWVVDDLAPSSDPHQARSDEARIADLIRGSHNQSSKRRMNRDMTSRARRDPRALLIFTAENPLSVASVMDRVVHVPFRAGAIRSDQAKINLDTIRDRTGEAARVTGGVIRFFAQEIATHGYAAVHTRWKTTYLDELAPRAELAMEVDGRAARHVRLAADIALGLSALAVYAQEALGANRLAEQCLVLQDDLFGLLGDHHRAQQATTRGRSLLKALRSTLAAGHAHLNSPGIAGPPLDPDQDVDNQSLGWTLGAEPRGGGPTIGVVVSKTTDKGRRHYALFNPHQAFAVARRHHEDLLPPGTKADTSWQAMWDEGIAASPWQRRTTGAGNARAVVRTKLDGAFHEGVPIPIERLLGHPDPDTSDET